MKRLEEWVEALGGARLVSRHLRGEMKRMEERVEALGGARWDSHHLRADQSAWSGEMKHLEGRVKALDKAGGGASGGRVEEYLKNTEKNTL